MPEIAIVLNIELTEPQGQALAQFVKRVGWTDVRALAAGAVETHEMMSALEAVRRELSEHGYSPR